MKTRGSLLILILTLLRSAWSSVVVHKGKLNGEPCHVFSDCGDSPQSFLSCHRKICQCASFQYYLEQEKMCVSKIGERCEFEEPTDGLPMVRCGENTECRPLRHDRYGRCHCAPNFVTNWEGKCVEERSSSSHHHGNAILPDHPSHRRGDHGGHESKNGEGDGRNDKNQVVSFPFYSANTNTKMNSSSSNFKSGFNSNLFLHLLCLLISLPIFLPNG